MFPTYCLPPPYKKPLATVGKPSPSVGAQQWWKVVVGNIIFSQAAQIASVAAETTEAHSSPGTGGLIGVPMI
jgi:hypothetical protein